MSFYREYTFKYVGIIVKKKMKLLCGVVALSPALPFSLPLADDCSQ